MMITKNDVAKVFDTVLSIPGMSEMVKIDLKISRKNVLLLNHIIERGLSNKADNKLSILMTVVPDDELEELKAFGGECLQKAGLVELSEKLTVLSEIEGG